MAHGIQRVLLIAEGATLAHVGRPLVIARTLEQTGVEVVFARPPEYAWMTQHGRFEIVDLRSQPPAEFARRLDAGRPLYDLDTLETYVADDIALLRRFRPDAVIGDFRLSLSVSARLEGIPYATLCDAYWSPECPLDPIVPVLPFTRFMPIGLAQALFSAVAPIAFRLHARPMEALRRRHGLPGFGHDLRRCYTDADLRLFANPRELFPQVRPHSGAAFIGPIAWSPDTPLPDDFPSDPDLVYVSMGSSGNVGILDTLFATLASLNLPAVVATAGRPAPPPPARSCIRLYDFLPGREAIARSRLVVCNGGSPTTNQALAAGVPVLGIPQNMDQFLNMRAIEHYGCGIGVRTDRCTAAALHAALSSLLAGTPAHRAAQRVRAAIAAGEGLSPIADAIGALHRTRPTERVAT